MRPDSLIEAYTKAANRTDHEKRRLSQKSRDELAQKLWETRAHFREQLDSLRARHAAQREADMAQARLQLLLQRPQPDYKPPDVPAARRAERDRIKMQATAKVDACNALEIAQLKTAMRFEFSAAIESFLGQQPEFAAERESVDLLRAQWAEMREATRYEGHADFSDVEREDPDRGRVR